MVEDVEEEIVCLRKEADLGNQEAMLKLARTIYPINSSFSELLVTSYHEGYNDAKIGKLNKYGFGDVGVGDIIKFGNYSHIHADEKEPIKWKVLELENEEALIISYYVLDYQKFNQGSEATSWERCSLRQWLNNDFLNSAFNKDEQEIIQLSKVRAEFKEKADISPKYISDQGNDTEDKVFILSINEMERYFGNNRYNECIATKYTVDCQNRLHHNPILNIFWLRTMGYGIYNNSAIASIGSGVEYWGYKVYNYGYIRPAMRIRLK